MVALAYLRVSTVDQGESRAGLQAQLDAIQRVYGSVEVFEDVGVGGATGLDRRDGLLCLLTRMGEGDELVVSKRDRIGRDPVVVAMVEAAVRRRGGRVVSIAGEGTGDDSPTSVLMRRIVDAFAEYERLIIRARTRAALQSLRVRGRRVGHVPYGYQVDPARPGYLVEHPEEQKVLGYILDLREGGMSWNGLVDHLRKNDMVNRHARPWSRNGLRVMVGNAQRRISEGFLKGPEGESCKTVSGKLQDE